MDCIKYLTMAGVPHALHAEAMASLSKSSELFKLVRPYKWKAPFVIAKAVQSLPWEAENLPEKLWRYDNEVSLNGDYHEWVVDPVTGIGARIPAPLQETAAQKARCYYAKGHAARSRWARWIFIGIRNRGSLYAFKLGPEASNPIEFFGDLSTGKDHEGVVVWRMGPHWQIYATSKFGPFCIRRNMGVKISNVYKHGAKRAMVVKIPFSILGWKKPKKV